MSKFRFAMALGLSALAAASAEAKQDVSMEEILGGSEGLACEVLLCLSSAIGEELKECEEPLREFQRIKPDRRPAFLAQCPKEQAGQK